MKKSLKEQLNHWFYKESDEFREGIKMEQLAKAAEKYPKPFEPTDWTARELVTHAMQENYDQQNYIYGLYLAIKHLEQQNEQLSHELTTQIENTKFWFVKSNELQKENLKLKHKG